MHAGGGGRDRRPRARSCPAPARALLSETLELTAEAAAARRRRRARRHALLRPRPAAGPVRLVRARSRASSPTCRSSSTTCRSARRWTSRRRPSAGCAARTTTSSASRRRRSDFEHVSYVLDECGTRLHRAVRDRAALLPDARARRRGHLSCVGELRAASRAPSSTTRSSPATTSGARELHYDLHPLVDAAFAETNPGPRSGSWSSSESWNAVPSGRRSRRPRHRAARRSPRSSSARACSSATPFRPRWLMP